MQIQRLHEDVRVDSTAGAQRPSVTPFATPIGDNGVLVAWQAPAGIGLQVLTDDGGLAGPPRQIPVPGGAVQPLVVGTGFGAQCVWLDRAAGHVVAQRIGSNGPVGASTVLDTGIVESDQRLGIATLLGDGAVVCWTGRDAGGLGVAPRLQRLNQSGQPLATSVAAPNGDGLYHSPSVCFQQNSGVLVTWTHEDQGTLRLRGRRFDAEAAQVVPVDQDTAIAAAMDIRGDTAATGLVGGSYLVAWIGGGAVRVRVVPPSLPLGTQATDAAAAADRPCLEPAVAKLPDGGAVVAWTRSGPNGERTVHARILSDDGFPLGDEVALATSAGDQFSPALATLADRFLATWTHVVGGQPSVRAVTCRVV